MLPHYVVKHYVLCVAQSWISVVSMLRIRRYSNLYAVWWARVFVHWAILLRGPLFFSGVAWFQWKSEDAVIELNCRNATVNGNVLHITQVISHLSPHRRTHAASYTWLDVPSVCEFVATTAERTDMPFGEGGGEEFRGPTNHVSLLDGVHIGATWWKQWIDLCDSGDAGCRYRYTATCLF